MFQAPGDEPAVASVPDVGDSPAALPFPIVGIGASAGGLEPLIELFSHLPANTGIAFVVVPHLAPDKKIHFPEIFAKNTAIPVSKISHHSRPVPNKM
jgi:two-component system, chemotaxis family, CheB/CheR fusion protein